MLNSNSVSVSLESLSIFAYSRSNVNFKVKYDFSTIEARNKCNTSFSCDFDWGIYFLNYFDYSRSSSRSKSQFQGHVKNISFLKSSARNIFFHGILTGKSIYRIILGIHGPLQGRKVNSKVKNVKSINLRNTNRKKCNTSFSCDFETLFHGGGPRVVVSTAAFHASVG